MRKRVLSLCMALAMCLSLLPSPVLATGLPRATGETALDTETSISAEYVTSIEKVDTDTVTEEADKPVADVAPDAMTAKTDELSIDEASKAEPDFATLTGDVADVEVEADEIYAELFGSVLDECDLLMYYLEQEAGVLPEASLMAEAGESLTGLEAAIYKVVKATAKEIAAGRRQSTEIQISIPSLGYTLAKTNLSPSEINTDKKKQAIIATLICSVCDKAVYSAYADCPYDFYWHTGNNYLCSYNATTQTTNNVSSVTVNVITLRFPVGANYRGSGDYTVKSGLDTLISTVQSNAKTIVMRNVGKSDYAKLKAYKDEICKEVAYDFDAAKNYSTSGYDNNPWQLMYVFDGIPSTNVVCEGYAKAFKFLCDLSVFQDSNFACYQVRGVMSGGPHRWNHVTLGGQTYLVDVTNCDEGMSGYPDGLFMKHAMAGKNTRATGYVIPMSDTKSETYTNIDKNSPGSFYDENAPFLTLATTPYPGTAQNSLSFSPNSVSIQVGKEQTVIISCANGDFSYWSYEIASKNEIISVEWGPADKKTATSHSLVITGLKAGTETVKVSLLDSDKNEITSDSFSITVTPTPKYKVTIIDGTGSGDYEEGDTVTISANSAPTDCKIWGWRGGTSAIKLTFVKNSPTKQASFTMPDYDVTFRALYSYAVTLDPNGGALEQNSEELKFTRDKTYIETYDLPTPARVGYAFEGWHTEKTGGVKVESGSTPVAFANHTLYAHWSSSNDLQIEVANASAFKDTTVNLPVTIKNNPGISGAALTVSYDKSVLTLNSVQKGSVFATGTYSADTSTGVVIWYHTENVTDNGTLFTLQFAVNSNAGVGRYPVTVGLREGKATNLTNTDSASVSAEFLSGALEVMSGVRGDVTGDGDVAINDVVKVARAVARKITFTESERALADVTGDGFIAINDVVKLARYVAGSIASLQSVETAALADGASAVIEAATVNGKPGEIIRVPVSITSNPGIAGAQLDILFDNGLTLKNVIQGDVMSEGTFEPDVSAGMIQWYYGQANVMSAGVLFTLEFEVSAEAKNGDAYAITVNVTDGISANLSDYDSNPVNAEFKPGKIQISETADNTAITTVSRNGNTITANVVCADSNASVFCAVYNNSGKMIAVRSVQITGESNYQFQFDGQPFDYAKAFIVDDNFRPLCESKKS